LSRPFKIEPLHAGRLLRLTSADGMNRLTHACILALTETVRELASTGQPLIIAGNSNFFSVGADLNEISRLSAPAAYEFSKMGQTLMNEIEHYSAPVYAVVSGHCMGGGLDLALACHRRIAAPHALFGHRGAALGLVTGWGGTQRLPRLIGRARALEMFVAAERITAERALRMGLVDVVCPLPEKQAIDRLGISQDGKDL
jgi:enoyl-CoA hydratase/carnithine racemase